MKYQIVTTQYMMCVCRCNLVAVNMHLVTVKLTLVHQLQHSEDVLTNQFTINSIIDDST